MRRREFIAGLGATFWPLAARAQQRTMPVIGLLSSNGPLDVAGPIHAFHLGLAEAGYVENKNVAIDQRWAENHNDRLPALALDLIRRRVAVIVAFGPASALAAKAATSTIPIVFRSASDPVELGLVASLNRPDRNITGVASLGAALGAKRLELLHELAPNAASIAALINPASPNPETREWEAAARAFGVRLVVLNASSASEIDSAFAILVEQRIGALLEGSDPLFFAQRQQLVALAARHRVLAMYHSREAVDDGGLMSYGPNIPDGYRLAGTFVGRILNGEKPADLPVQQSVKLEMILNLKTAKALGLE
jgi:putative ABC transport system substrate-binding protein